VSEGIADNARPVHLSGVAEPDPDTLIPWIVELHRRIERGELRGLPLIHLDRRLRVHPELVARIMLDELEAFDELPPDERACLENIAKRRSLLWDLLWLREQIG